MQAKTLNYILESDIGKRLIAILSKRFGDCEAINADTSLALYFGTDSIDIVELIMEIEKEFKIDIPVNIFNKTLTIERLIFYVILINSLLQNPFISKSTQGKAVNYLF